MNICIKIIFLIAFLYTSFSLFSKYEPHECAVYAYQHCVQNGKVNAAFFSPKDEIKKIIIGLIELEKRSIRAALYQLTDKSIVEALCRAHKRGIKIEIITDKSCAISKYGKIKELKKHKIKVWIYDKGNSLMHHKSWVFEKNLLNKSILVNGSSNPTVHGTQYNQENIMVLDNPILVKKFYYQFEELKKYIIARNPLYARSAKKGATQYSFRGALLNFLSRLKPL